MPEMVEVELYRRLAEAAIGLRISGVDVLDPRVVRGQPGGTDLTTNLVGRRVTAARRLGKLLLLDTGPVGRSVEVGPTLGLRFGMTGSLVLDGHGSVALLYAPPSFEERWARFRLRLTNGRVPRARSRQLVLHDPRRLGRVQLDPPEDALGPDAAAITVRQLATALASGSRGGTPGTTPLKARLMDQARIAGIGNLIADEVLWRAGLSPARSAGSVSSADIRRLHRHLRATLADLCRRGGSHTGDLMSERRDGGRCPKDCAALVRSSVGGRTTWWCPAHQV